MSTKTTGTSNKAGIPEFPCIICLDLRIDSLHDARSLRFACSDRLKTRSPIPSSSIRKNLPWSQSDGETHPIFLMCVCGRSVSSEPLPLQPCGGGPRPHVCLHCACIQYFSSTNGYEHIIPAVRRHQSTLPRVAHYTVVHWGNSVRKKAPAFSVSAQSLSACMEQPEDDMTRPPGIIRLPSVQPSRLKIWGKSKQMR